MTLATRCTACGTAFRVVQDQLKVANGWVRCGRCAQVFDASGALFAPDRPVAIESETQVDVQMPASTPQPAAATVVDAGSGDGIGAPMADRPPSPSNADVKPVDMSADGAGSSAHAREPLSLAEQSPDPTHVAPPEPPRWLLSSSVTTAPVVDIGIGSVAPPVAAGEEPEPAAADDDDGEQPDFVDARFNEDLLAGLPGLRDPDHGGDARDLAPVDATATELPPGRTQEAQARSIAHVQPDGPASMPPSNSDALPTAVDEGTGPPLAGHDAVPTFLRRRGRDARQWQRHPVRAALGASAALLILALGLQAALHWRDWLATRWPSTAPWLAGACAPVGCRVQPLRRIDDLGVDSTALAPVVADSPALRLSVVLANRGDLPLAAPSVDLALTDASGELVARKVLTASDFHTTGAVLKPGATVRWQTVLLPSGEHVTGYTVELFYP